jgi:iron complex transport system ATP-binding protein
VEPVLSMDGVSFRYGDVWVLKDLTFAVHEGEILGIMGPNASGKTTMLRLMDGILRPQEGLIDLMGENLRTMSRKQVARRIGVVAQEAPMLYAFSALEVVLMGRSAHLPPFGFEGPRDFEIAMRSLERTGCADLSDRLVNELSGGERQRVLIARALAQEPRILLMDEPTVYLDLRHQMEFLDLLLRLHHDEGISIVWVSHDLNLASMACQRLILMKEGRIHALGEPTEVLMASTIETVFGRRVFVDTNPQRGTPRVTPLLETDTSLTKSGGHT